MEWLPLTDYSTKYKVSVSTLRRKIKAEDIRYRFEDGKYLIFDCPPEVSSVQHRPSQGNDQMASEIYPAGASASPQFSASISSLLKEASVASQAVSVTTNQNKIDEPILAAANRLLNELKKAYTQILQEKEEQILQLKEEVSDLKTLVRVLESENERLKPSHHHIHGLR